MDRLGRFQTFIRRWHVRHGRHQLPWRQTYDPYHVLVSEMMLQQTQVERVIPKFEQFMKRYPSFVELAEGSTAELLKNWQGLGYNRRALNLQRTAQAVTSGGGDLPNTTEELLALPGIGPYTASAIMAFAYNQPVVVIETNIRTVFIYHFFPEQTSVSDTELLPLIEQSLDQKNPREWYSALMDYGSYLKSVLPNPTRQSKSYTKQSKFTGSNRQLRGAILKQLTLKDSVSSKQILDTMPEQQLFSPDQIAKAIETLEKEGFITRQKNMLRLKT